MKKQAILIASIFAGFSLAQAQQPDLGTEEQRQAGKILYDEKCAQCHGINGDGKGVAGDYFKPKPRDFTRGTYKIRTTKTGELPTDQDLKDIIRKGMPYTGMPPWPDLSDQQITNLMYYIKTFSDAFADPEYIPQESDLTNAPAYSEESALAGRAVFEANECIACHGNFGRSDGATATGISDDWGDHIRPADMTKRWTFRGGSTREDIYRTFLTGMNGTPMPSYDGLITPEDQWRLVDYVYSLSRDEPDYGTLVTSKPYVGDIDLALGDSLFSGVEMTYFSIFGQVIEPGREFYPGASGIEVTAVHNENDIAIRLKWNDMSAEQGGQNNPALEVPRFEPSTGAEAESDDPFAEDADPFAEEVEEDPFADEADPFAEEEDPFAEDDPFADPTQDPNSFSDAVAIQFPRTSSGAIPYLIFGDRRTPADLWFSDLATGEAQTWIGKGSENVELDSVDTALSVWTNYDQGQWTAIFKRSRQNGEDRMTFDEGKFIPIAFSTWDGFNEERGNKRGMSSWYYIYLEPLQKQSAMLPMMKLGFFVLVVELLIVFAVRMKNGKKSV